MILLGSRVKSCRLTKRWACWRRGRGYKRALAEGRWAPVSAGRALRTPGAGLAARIYGGLELLYLPVAEEVVDAGEVPQSSHPPLMTLPGRRGQGVRARLCRGAQSGGIVGENGPMGAAPREPPRTRMRASLYEGGMMLEVPAGTDAETETLAWLMGALERARGEGHERLAGYLEAVADDVVFEAEAAARGAGG